MPRARFALASLALLAACDNVRGSSTPQLQLNWGPASNSLYTPPDGGGIEGDWFLCEDDDCSRFDSGVRLAADGTWTDLNSQRGNDGRIESYCVDGSSGGERGRYRYDGARLTVTDDRERTVLEAQIQFDGDEAILSSFSERDSDTVRMKRFDPVLFRGSCSANVIPQPPPVTGAAVRSPDAGS